MRRLVLTTCLLPLLAGPGAAQERLLAPALSCQALKTAVARGRDVVVASSETAYDIVHAEGGACLNVNGETSEPVYVPTTDEPNCLAGWRCMQRSSDGSSSH
ncbi:hypothetical protein [Methylobacterium radiodurans]|uniref:Uncharacterized protein n=1 Tax=Methylobacterium radiodurans TaxID=2202828 RepID=A0A2U8VWD1_9HYPH|nr:hypothetical protein [Methylobacterium radiodurans]AWN38107.1 hypothetical protein DK427_22160 [Methylobacterium radiodurans]